MVGVEGTLVAVVVVRTKKKKGVARRSARASGWGSARRRRRVFEEGPMEQEVGCFAFRVRLGVDGWSCGTSITKTK